MQLDFLIAHHPRVYHMAAAGSWESIRRHGLLSTTALLDLFECDGLERRNLEERHRPEIVMIKHVRLGVASVRDQKPMSDNGLTRCLRDMEPAEWYRLLNSKVFFWATEERLRRMLHAHAYRNFEHDVLIVDTGELLRRHGPSVSLSPINSGCTKPYPHPRGPQTFCRVAAYPYEEWRRKRGRQGHALVEVAVDHAVPDVAEFVHRVERRRGSDVIEVLWAA